MKSPMDETREFMDKLIIARVTAAALHDGMSRKYTGEPYIVHPEAVCDKLFTFYTHDIDVLVAALMHDVVEDTGYTLKDIESMCNSTVAELVALVTNDKTLPRKARKRDEINRLKNADVRAKDIKLADAWHNMPTIIKYDKKFAPLYVSEKRMLLEEALYDGTPALFNDTMRIIEDFEQTT